MSLNDNEVYRKATDTWGKEAQLLVAVEEMSELIKAIMKHINRGASDENLIEEIADVDIMVGQMKCLFNRNQIEKIKREKIVRLYQRLSEIHERR